MADLKSSILYSLGQESNQPTCSNQGILGYLMTQRNNTPLVEYLSIKGYSILVDICQGSGQGSSQGRLNIPQPQPCPMQQQLQSRRPLKPFKPLYTVMIGTAITTLKESGGSSRKPSFMYIVSYKKIADVAKAYVLVKLIVRKMLAIKGSIKLAKVEKEKKPKKKPAKK